MPDAHANLAVSAVATAPSPATSGTSLVVTAAQGARFPAVPFNATIWPTGTVPDPTNAEIVRVTARSTDTLTITRAQESTSARTVIVGDLIAATITVKTLTDVETSPTIGGSITLTQAASEIIPGATSLSFRNNADSADNLLISNAGVVTVRAGLTVTAGGLTVSTGEGNVWLRIAELGGAAASYDFTSIPQTFRHLMLVVYVRSDTAAVQTQLRMRLQNVSTASYYDELVTAAAATVAASEAIAATSGRVGIMAAASAPGTLMGTTQILIPHYTQINKEKPWSSTTSWLSGVTTGTIQIGQSGGVLDSSSAIDRVTLFPLAGSFVADSICTLYGLPR